MTDEQNGSIDEMRSSAEDLTSPALVSSDELVAAPEEIRDEEDNLHARTVSGDEEEDDHDQDEQDEGSQSSSASSAGSAAGAAGATICAVAVVAFVLTTAVSGITAVFHHLDVYGTSFDYELEVAMDYEETADQVIDFNDVDTGLVLMVTKNGFEVAQSLVTGSADLPCTVTMEPVDTEEDRQNEESTSQKYHVKLLFSGSVTGLAENTRYRIAVIGDEDGKTVTYATQDVKTTTRVSTIRGVEANCTCAIDGAFNFKLDYEDENDFYSDFYYEFMDEAGSVVRSGGILEPWSEQHIQGVDELPGQDYILVISFSSSAPTDVAASDVTTRYNDGSVTVRIDQGTVTITANVKI